MSSPDPLVTVVVATHGRADVLVEALDAIDGQTLDGAQVVVVDDESPDATPDVLRQRRVRWLRVSRRGPGRARDAGWRAVTSPIIAFTDDDCIPAADWLEHLVRPILDGDADFVQGRTMPRPDHTDRRGRWSRTQRIERENGLYQTCNIAYRREVLEAVGGFRPEFSGPLTAGEDTDLAWRALEAGYRSAFEPSALVHHAVWPATYLQHLADRRRRAMVVQVVRYHPAARRLGHHRYFYRASHERIVVAAAAVVLAAGVRRWAPLALIGAFGAAHLVRTRRDPEPPHRRTMRLGQSLLADAVEVAAFTQASVRYRTLFL